MAQAGLTMSPYHFPGAQVALEIPVYRCGEDQYYKDKNSEIRSLAQPTINVIRAHGTTKEHFDQIEDTKNRLRENLVHLWDFNEVVAWIRIYTRVGAIGGSLFIVSKRVTSRTRYRKFVWDSNNFIDLGIEKGMSNPQIFHDVRKTLISVGSKRFRKTWVIDLSVLDVLGPNIDWLALTR